MVASEICSQSATGVAQPHKQAQHMSHMQPTTTSNDDSKPEDSKPDDSRRLVRADAALMVRLKVAAVRRQMTQTDLLNQIIAEWLTHNEDTT